LTKRLIGIALACLLLAGCPGAGENGSNVDAGRLEVLKREPVLKLAVGKTYSEVGFRVSDKLPLHRSKVTADLTKPADAGQDQRRTVEAVKVLRDSGWTVYHVRCDPNEFMVAAYKIVDGVSYYAQINGSDVQDGQNAAMQLLAPHSRESTSDLFPERPPALPAGKTCLESNATETGAGPSILVDEQGPDPNGPAKPSGHR
jgi:hypothetical protein